MWKLMHETVIQNTVAGTQKNQTKYSKSLSINCTVLSVFQLMSTYSLSWITVHWDQMYFLFRRAKHRHHQGAALARPQR